MKCQAVASVSQEGTQPEDEDEVAFTEGAEEGLAAKRAAEMGGAVAAEAMLRGPHLRGARVRTCIAGFDLGIPLDLALLADQLPNTQYTEKGTLQLRGLRPHRYVAEVGRRGRISLRTNVDEEEVAYGVPLHLRRGFGWRPLSSQGGDPRPGEAALQRIGDLPILEGPVFGPVKSYKWYLRYLVPSFPIT
ncbi:unnamed protein product [Symbiodinium natans]|uniref:Uncharacterized protein n=1 Tax=Symbiodinium natans TaxID=878477 RepID=A0A812L3S0_9DINO|nr:unnamed protein product [Symbiodinium natans]